MLILQFGWTPLMLAAERGHLEVVMYLVSQGSQLETKGKFGRTPLMWAAEYGHLEVVTYLASHGSQLEARDTVDGYTALHGAAGNGQIDVTKWCIDQGCSPWVKTKQVTFSFNHIRQILYSLKTKYQSTEKVELQMNINTNTIVECKQMQYNNVKCSPTL
ncbi:fibronectin type 3 and ankyrin repeat domains 1 protein-like [Mytilus trossulus]|uniref:fibronectin type 3 and ankyrin repeat domains 1 protein-like n=1 Tax=Mytilus trossulus TaxID=6551 RepID=UPI00300422C8